MMNEMKYCGTLNSLEREAASAEGSLLVSLFATESCKREVTPGKPHATKNGESAGRRVSRVRNGLCFIDPDMKLKMSIEQESTSQVSRPSTPQVDLLSNFSSVKEGCAFSIRLLPCVHRVFDRVQLVERSLLPVTVYCSLSRHQHKSDDEISAQEKLPLTFPGCRLVMEHASFHSTFQDSIEEQEQRSHSHKFGIV